MRDNLRPWILFLSLLGAPAAVCAQAPDTPATRPRDPATASTALASSQDPAYGAVPAGQLSATPVALSLADAIARGLRYNLAGLLGQEGIRSTEAAQRRSRSQLMPNLTAGVSESQQQANLRAMGFGGFPGMRTIVGPFSVFDTRVYFSQAVFDLRAIRDERASSEWVNASEFNYRNTRERIVFVVGDLYLQTLAGRSRIDSMRVQVDTAQSLYDLAVDRKQAGVVPGIDVLRAQVELQAQQQRLIVAENDFAKQKLNLARAIGLPLGQDFSLTEELPYAALAPMSLEQALERAYRERADYQGALAQVRAAEAARKAAEAERLPSLRVNANYGINGPAPGWTHGTYTLAASVRIPIYEGGQVEARILEADSALKQRQAEAADLKGRIYYEIQASFLNLQAAEQSLRVAESSVRLAREQLDQAQDRFGAGVASNIEVVQAQEALAGATESYISSLYYHNITKGKLAQTLGAAESSFVQFLRGN